MKSNGKPSTCFSDNPKMGKPYQSQGKGYRDGGRVPDEDDTSRVNVSGGGRVGVDIPMSRGRNLSVGVSGGGYGAGKEKDFSVTGADLSYRKGDTTIGVEVSKQPTKLGDKRIMFRYKKEY